MIKMKLTMKISLNLEKYFYQYLGMAHSLNLEKIMKY